LLAARRREWGHGAFTMGHVSCDSVGDVVECRKWPTPGGHIRSNAYEQLLGPQSTLPGDRLRLMRTTLRERPRVTSLHRGVGGRGACGLSPQPVITRVGVDGFRGKATMNLVKLGAGLVGIALVTASCRDYSSDSRELDSAEGESGASSTQLGDGGGGGLGLATSPGAGGSGGAAAPASGGAAAGGHDGNVQAGASNDDAGGASGGAGTPPDADAGAWFGGEEPTLIPPCALNEPKVPHRLSSLAASVTYDGLQVVLYAWDEHDSTAVLNWSASVIPTVWVGWRCFDIVPRATRIAALNLPNGYPEVFMATAGGSLFVRRQSFHWTGWLPFSLPSSTAVVSDLAAVSGQLPRIYIVDRGRVFVRSKVGAEPYSNYGAWQRLAKNGALFLTAIQRVNLPERAHQVVTVDAVGGVQTALQGEASESFGEWSSLTPLSRTVVDLDAVETDHLNLFALDVEGNVLKNAADVPGSPWTLHAAADPLAQVRAITARVNGHEIQLFGIDSAGMIYQLIEGFWTR
jgi:hypothetical protein